MIKELIAKIGLDNSGFVKSLEDSGKETEKIKKKVSEFGEETEKASNKGKKSFEDFKKKIESLSKDLTSLGKKFSVSLTAPLTVFSGLTLNTFGNFEQSMNKAAAITGATGEAFDALKSKARDLGATTEFSASQSAEAITFLGMAGFDTEKILGSLDDTLKLASASGLDLGRSADIVSNVLTGFGLETDKLGSTVDVLSKAFTRSNTDLSQLAEAIKYAGPVAASFGVVMEETVASLGFLSDAGIQASSAGTGLRRVMGELAKSGEKLGIKTLDASGKLRPLADIIEDIEKRGLTASESLEIFGLQGGPVLTTLLSRGSAELRKYTEELQNSGGTADRLAKSQTQGLNGALKRLRSTFEELQLRIGESGLAKAFEKLVDVSANIILRLSKLDDRVINTVTIIAGLAASIGPVLLGLGSIIKLLPILQAGLASVTAIASPLILKIAAITAAAVGLGIVAKGLIDSWSTIKDFFSQMWDNIKITFNNATISILEKLNVLFDKIGLGFSDTISKLKTESQKLMEALDAKPVVTLGDVFSDIGSNIKKTFVGIKESANENFNSVKSDIGKASDVLADFAIKSKMTFEEFSKLSDAANKKVFSDWEEDVKKYNEELQNAISLQKRIAGATFDFNKMFGRVKIQDFDIQLTPPISEYDLALMNEANIQADNYYNSLHKGMGIVQSFGGLLTQTFADILQSGQLSFKSIIQGLKRMIAQLIAAAAAAMALNVLLGGVGIAGFGKGAGGFGKIFGALSGGAGGIGGLFGMPEMARGGMVTGLTAAVIGDNPSGKEAVIPFERMGEFLGKYGGGGSQTIEVVGNFRNDAIYFSSASYSQRRNRILGI